VSEDFDAYQRRLLGYVKGRDPRRILRATPGSIARKIGRASRRRLTRRPAPGKWSVAHVLAHLAELELLWGYRMRMILEKSGAEVAGMDQDAWARNSRYERIDPRRSLEMFRSIRRANLDLAGGLSSGALRRYGNHSQFGRLTIGRILELLAGHDVNHTRQIDALLAGRRPAARRRR
jgi:uncharacterized damage-inducible protein DinB